MKKIEIEIPDGKRAEWLNGVLTLVDDTPRDITERIKSFMDAYCELGNDHPFVKSYEKYVNTASGEEADVIAYLKLRIITAALNEGWKPQFVEGEKRWYAWYDFITEEDYNNTTSEIRIDLRSGYSVHEDGGLVFAHESYAGLHSDTYHSVRLAFKSKDLAEYAAKQFIEEYLDFCFKRK